MRSEIGQTLMLLTRDFQRRLDADLKARGVQGIGARHRAVFLFLGRNGASRAVELAQSAGIRPQSMMRIVHELEAMGMVERRADPADQGAVALHRDGMEAVRGGARRGRNLANLQQSQPAAGQGRHRQ